MIKRLCQIFVLLLLSTIQTWGAGADKYVFEHIPASAHWINSIFKDETGFIWVSSRTGLYRFASDDFSTYDLIYNDSGCLEVLQASDGRLWVRTNSAYIIYDPLTRTFRNEAQTAKELDSEIWIETLDIDGRDRFWWTEGVGMYCRVAAQGEKIYLGEASSQVYDIFCRDNIAYFLTIEGDLYRYTFDAQGRVVPLTKLKPEAELSDGSLDYRFYCVFVDSRHNIWLSQGARGLWFYKNGSAQAIHLEGGTQAGRIPEGFICAIEEDAEGNVWVASDHGGIAICDRNARVLQRLNNVPGDDKSLAANGVHALYRDAMNNMWAAHTKRGISLWRGSNQAWTLSHIEKVHDQGLSDDINTICQDAQGNIWLGTDGYGLYRIDKAGRETRFTAANSPLNSDVITKLFCDSNGRVWIGTFFGGLSCYEQGRLRTWDYRPEALSSENIWDICEDPTGLIWLGTLGGGLQSFDPQTGVFETFNTRNSALSNDYVSDIEYGPDGNIYIATSYELSIFNPLTKTMRVVDSGDQMLRKGITSLKVDELGRVWLDEEGSLQLYEPSTGRFYTPEHPSLKAVRSVIADAQGTVWVVTDDGLCKVMPETTAEGYAFKVSSYGFNQIPDLHFNQRSACLLADGDFLIGSFCGYLRFSPERFKEPQTPHVSLHFTELYLGNTPILPGREYGDRIILEKAMEYTESIKLRHNQSQLTIAFVCQDNFSVQQPTLYYRLQGLSDEWISLDRGARSIAFASISPGRYTLSLTSAPLTPGSGISLQVRILPSPWESWWAIIIYIAAGIALIVLIVKYYRRRSHQKRLMAEKSLMRERQHYIDEMKMQFFTNVSHDFRTPLTLILNPLEERMRTKPELRDDKLISTIYRNAQRLQNLVNEVLDLRKIEMYGSRLNPRTGDFVRTVRDVVTSFELMASGQNISLNLSTDKPNLIFDYDQSKMEKILTNLLSNAFKFTPSGGSVTVSITDEGDFIQVRVADTGCGISDQDKRRVFDRFYQAADSQSGSGIGLHVVREFVLLHGGEIHILDNKPTGTVFQFTIPQRHSQPQPAEDKGAVTGNLNRSSEEPQPQADAPEPDQTCSTVLVVDDNDDFREFLSATLSDEYHVLTAPDGSAALKMVEDHDVDVVVCDVMMPLMDGFEFCRRMKSNLNTSHIPVILLTAKALQEDEYQGLESGADDYLTKPFNMSILRLKLVRFIQWKQRTKRMFEKELEITTEQMTLTPMDDRLLQSAINIINENISNPDFSVEDLSSALHMHRASLYKKLVYITGRTPVEFIRALRLKRAAVLLQTDGVYVSEVAYMVGFNSPKVFAGHFRDEFGCSPTEYRKKNK